MKTAQRQAILLIDHDDQIMNLLKKEGYLVTHMGCTNHALHQLHKWDVVIMNPILKDECGYAFSQKVRQHFSLCERPILLLLPHATPDEINYAFQSGANDYVKTPVNKMELLHRVKALLQLKTASEERTRSETEWLRAQIQPHFLFNVLNTIASLGEIDTDRMVHLLDEFGHYLKSSFDPLNLQLTAPIEHELDLLRAYVYIEQERFRKRLHIQWDCEEELSFSLPPLSIQTLVENAIKHGVLKQAKGGTIIISMQRENEAVRVTITDDGVGMSEQQVEQALTTHATKGFGLAHTHQRLKRLYGEGLHIRSTLNEGTTISFSVPVNEKRRE
ncbi:histidine kinase [Metabacillus iocasae]|uniref:histidine kinase n=1 Tax=Priestia iocasae TaxID=2291674 RepID=A0ABS2QSZ4_9BACI|nr:histidine kinase [Metabacillus iocasae]MBM7702398.1 sensor histidine kinase YesM [Metabacillus iocasae]